jgi:hypothetical protein
LSDRQTVPPPPDGRAFRTAVLNGVGDPKEALRDYLEQAEPRLADLLWRIAGSLEPDDAYLLFGLEGALISLLSTVRESGGLYRLKFTRRRGNPAHTLDETLRADDAALLVMTLVNKGDKQESAISDAEAATGVMRREIFRRLAHFRRRQRRFVQQKLGADAPDIG